MVINLAFISDSLKALHFAYMRSYYEHLSSSFSQVSTVQPVLRSSAIFPVIEQKSVHTRLLFLGYWLLKRGIVSLKVRLTLRDLNGLTLNTDTFTLSEAKAYRIEACDLLPFNGQNFFGSLEIEFLSETHMAFAFPAVVCQFYSSDFSAFVHTGQRVYNSIEDMQKNSVCQVAEGGFTLYVSEHDEPFLTCINGSQTAENSQLELEIINYRGVSLTLKKHLGNLAPYQTLFLYPAQDRAIQSFLEGHPGTAKVKVGLNMVFPRLLVGNWDHRQNSYTLTHTFYDCSAANQQTDYWSLISEDFESASLMLPLFYDQSHQTHVMFYPIYSPATFWVDAEIYNKQGQHLATLEKIWQSQQGFFALDMRLICLEQGIDEQPLALRLIAKAPPGELIPARIKIGLDVSLQQREKACNICINLQPYQPALTQKPQSFKWSPVFLGQGTNGSVWIMNSSPEKNYRQIAQLTLTFYREQDTKTLEQKRELLPHSFLILSPFEDRELEEFFQGQTGWVSIRTNCPYLTLYYFSEDTKSGIVGGDHGF